MGMHSKMCKHKITARQIIFGALFSFISHEQIDSGGGERLAG